MSSQERFLDPDSIIFPAGKIYLRLGHVSKNMKQFIFFSHVRPPRFERGTPKVYRLRYKNFARILYKCVGVDGLEPSTAEV